MIDPKETKKIKEGIEEFFGKMTITTSSMEVSVVSAEEDKDIVNVDLKIEEPQILIGQGGQTLFEIQRLLRAVLSKNIGKFFYFNLDINDYKKQKVGYLKDMVKGLADQVANTKEEKVLPAMSSYERRVVHAELSQRTDVLTESQGEGLDRHIVIKPK